MDLNVHAFRLVHQAAEEANSTTLAKRNAARKGGATGGRARAKALTSEQRAEVARKAGAARWNKGQGVADKAV